MKLKEHRAIVLHEDAGQPKNGNIEGLVHWMKNERPDGAFYHRFVSGSRIVYGRSTAERCIHCGNNTYTREATAFFGEEHCPPWDHRERPHLSSPNNCTIAICMLHDFEGGGFSGETLRTTARLCSELMHFYDLSLEAIWTHTMIVGQETKLCPRAFHTLQYQWEYFQDMLNHFLNEMEAAS
ncbi:N-acetylmuramoyl-L-alanine amidase [Marispirochaeta aestuarii]|uniref:N-acetylmuramoyl-L-alanine amidase n=1 Tax=Marispirochaeta aestuarii TaxID=1963862 RepID=UPI002ABE5DB8|nr:N-acetylmuramoyl-L-alanine amidase [Marispirochaeta aestuarii]